MDHRIDLSDMKFTTHWDADHDFQVHGSTVSAPPHRPETSTTIPNGKRKRTMDGESSMLPEGSLKGKARAMVSQKELDEIEAENLMEQLLQAELEN